MQETKQKFYELADVLLRESGLLANRPTWIKLRQLVHDAPPDFLESDCRSRTFSILLILLRTYEKSAERTKKLAVIIEAACKAAPDEAFINILTHLSPDDLTITLLPHIYCSDSRGSIAVYLAARARLNLDPEAFQYFLTARPWNQTDLINLSFLVRPAEQLKVSTLLEQAAAGESSAVNREIFTEFRHILFGQPPQMPLLPDCATAEESSAHLQPDLITLPSPVAPPVQTQTDPETISEIQPVRHESTTSQEPEQVERPAHTGRRQPIPKVPPTKSPESRDASTAFYPALIKIIETNQTALLALFLLTTVFLLSTGISRWLVSDSDVQIKPPTNSDKLPSHWTDSTTREKITERFLAADKDYRMGELYLTRDRYSEALILFEDALAIRPDHTQALYRTGYCRLYIKDYAGARLALEKALSIDPALRHANLLLARVAAAQSDDATAEKHFKRELELAKDPAIAEEYANFLHNAGRLNEAEYLIKTYQALYPDRILVLSKKPAKPDNEEQRQ